jgi:hypothetical protein
MVATIFQFLFICGSVSSYTTSRFHPTAVATSVPQSGIHQLDCGRSHHQNHRHCAITTFDFAGGILGPVSAGHPPASTFNFNRSRNKLFITDNSVFMGERLYAHRLEMRSASPDPGDSGKNHLASATYTELLNPTAVSLFGAKHAKYKLILYFRGEHT